MAILGFLQAHESEHITAAQVVEHFERGDVYIGRTTVYRQLEKLVNSGVVRKYVFDESAGACFQYIGKDGCAGEHLHLMCEKCGELIHTDEAILPNVTKGILEKYEFTVDVNKSVFYGICRSCCDQGQADRQRDAAKEREK
jgi:Fur family ferric uptake transcriptional regulator